MTDAPHAPFVPGAPCVPLYACLRAARPQLDSSDSAASSLLTIARDFSPRVMRLGASEVLFDVSGLGGLIGDPAAIAAALARALADANVDARVAIAPTQISARLLADGSRDCIVTTDSATAIASLPVTRLQRLETLPPAMPVRDRSRPYDTFERWGIATLGDLAALPADELSSRLGRRGLGLQQLARGLDPRPFIPDRETPRFLGRVDLEWPIDSLEPLSFILARLLDPLSAALERADRGTAALRLDLRLTDRSTHSRVVQLPVAMRDARVLRTLLLLDLESHPPGAAIDVVTVEIDPAPARITQFSLLERALPSAETLSTLTARLSALVGETRCGAAELVDTHLPGAFAMTRFAPEEEMGGEGTRVSRGAWDVWGVVLRRHRNLPVVRVIVERGRPVHVSTTRRGMPCGAVRQAAGPWRTSGGWWEGSAQGARDAPGPCDADGRRTSKWSAWDRDEWDVALTTGEVCRIFQDRSTQQWFLEGTYD